MELLERLITYILLFEAGFFLCWYISAQPLKESWALLYKRRDRVLIDIEQAQAHNKTSMWAIEEAYEQLHIIAKSNDEKERQIASARLSEISTMIKHHNQRIRDVSDSMRKRLDKGIL